MVTMNPKVTERRLAKLPQVQQVVKVVADDFAGAAEAALAPHRKTGATEIKQKRAGKGLDRLITLQDLSEGGDVMAFEYGHAPSGRFEHSGTYVRGARVLGKAFASAV